MLCLHDTFRAVVWCRRRNYAPENYISALRFYGEITFEMQTWKFGQLQDGFSPHRLSSWVRTCSFPSPAAPSCCSLSGNDVAIVMSGQFSFLERPPYVEPSCFTCRQRCAAWRPLASCWTLFQSDMLALGWNYPPDFGLSCKWAVLVLDVCCMASCSFLSRPPSLGPCALLMTNQVWVLLGG